MNTTVYRLLLLICSMTTTQYLMPSEASNNKRCCQTLQYIFSCGWCGESEKSTQATATKDNANTEQLLDTHRTPPRSNNSPTQQVQMAQSTAGPPPPLIESPTSLTVPLQHHRQNSSPCSFVRVSTEDFTNIPS